MTDNTEYFEDVSNPLDSVEDILVGQNWAFSRMTQDELMVDVTGKLGTYRMVFNWQEDFSAMQFTCHFDLIVSPAQRDLCALALARVNTGLWLGHFDLPSDTLVPCFRHTSLFRGQTQTSGADHLQDLMDIALGECERFHPMFSLMTGEDMPDEHIMDLAVLDVRGEA